MPPRAAAPALALALAALAAIAAAPLDAEPLRVYYPDIEQGSATLVVSPTGSALLVDSGSELSAADDDLVSFVRELIDTGIVTSLDYVVASHYDEDHIGHLEDVLSHDLPAPTAIVYDRGEYLQTPSSFAYSDYAWAASFYDRRTLAPGTVIDLGGGVTVTCVVVNGQLPDGSSVDITGSAQLENAASVGLLVEYGELDVWIGGDLTGDPASGVADVESAAAPFAGDVDVYTVNHHGSRTSSNPTFLGTLRAEVAINQSSADNGFGHPNSEVVGRFLSTADSCGRTPLFVQQNPGNPTDGRSDDSLAAAIADPDDIDSVRGLAGTLLLVSDGVDYQISGGGAAPITLAADCAVSPVADFPPAVLTVDRSPWVPAAAEAVTVDADVRDEGTPTVTLDWYLDGVAQAPIAMSSTGGGGWTATLPAQADGARVAYEVRAIDGAGATARSRRSGYYSGTTPVAALRVADAEGVLLTAEYAARVEGRLSVEPGIFHPYVSQIFLEDDAGDGLQVFDVGLLALARGDRVRFVGELEQFAGQTELSLAQELAAYGHQLIGPDVAPVPSTATVAQVAAAGESWEGRLVRLDGVSVIDGTIPGPGEGNGYLTISDDGGVSALTLKIDGDTDVPGAATPTQPFDLVGVVTQFDAWPAFDDGYQVVPRERADLLSEEVNLPAMLIHEIHADPDPSAGDANGDGVVSSYHDEFIELANPSWEPVDLSGWTLADGVSMRHTFPAGTVVPAREAVVVFAGGSPAGDFGNAAANGLVFVASSGALGLNNSGDTVTLADASGTVVQSVVYGSEGGSDESLARAPDLTNAPLVRHSTVAPGGALYSPGTWAADGAAFTVPAGAVVLSEVLYDADGADGGFEWVELVNVSGGPIDLAARPLSLGWGGGDYTYGQLTLDSGTLAPCTPYVVGGPSSGAANGQPVFDRAVELTPGLQNSGSTADGVALFLRPASRVGAATVPADAVVYGGTNASCLLDETGACAPPDVADAPSGASIERADASGSWQVQGSPTPGTSPVATGCGAPPPPSCLDAAALAAGDLVLSEVLYDVDGADGGFEWIELYNASGQPVCLDGLSLGWGGSDYAYGGIDLAGTVAAGATWVVGGPSSAAANGSPAYDQPADLSPDLQNSGSTADGVALFLVTEAQVTASTVPYDAVVYGGTNASCLLDETGLCAAPDVADAAAGSSVERTSLAGAWQVQPTPSPGATPLP